MPRFACLCLPFCLALLAMLDTTRAASTFDVQIRPVLAKYCVRCHGAAKPKADINLERFQGTIDVVKDREIWEAVLENVRSHAMPPEKQAAPTAEERDRIVKWIDEALSRADASGQRDPGRVTMRRLNRAEYNNTVRDLIGVTFHPADDFPSDDVGYGFDNIGDVLSLPTILLEKYLAAADKIARAAIVTEETQKTPVKQYDARKMDASEVSSPFQDWAQLLATTGELSTRHHFAKAGDYLFRIRAFGQQAGPEPVRMALKIGDKELRKFDVKATRDEPEIYEVRAHVEAGDKQVAVAFLNDFYDPDGPKRHQDRNLVVEYLEIRGPVNLDLTALPATHKRIIFVQPTPETRDECAEKIISRFASRAFRRPARPEEVKRLLRLVQLAREQGDSFERGIQLVVQAVLVSPHFLFRVELDPAPAKSQPYLLSDYELASRLSYFLYSSMPDDELLAAAWQENLDKPEVLVAHVRRMLKDSKSQALVENFGGQWLQTRNLNVVAPDADRFPNFDDSLRAAMQTETELFFAAIMREDRGLLDFLDADFTFLNERLAKHYGIPGVEGQEFRRVTLPGHRRGGVITLASVLTVTSNPTRTSPVKRGKWILENVLGTPPPPPPPNVAELSEEEHVVLAGTLRQRMEQHRSDPACASCHQRMDPLGFGLENFNGVGAWRKQDGKFPIDASGTLPSGQAFNGPEQLKSLLKTKQDEFARCLAEKMLTYALGRGLEYHDRYAVERIVTAVAREQYKFSTLVIEIVKSEPFQMRRGASGRK